MEPKDELKECPFCGGAKFTRNTDSGDERIGYNITHTITCSGCGCSKSARSKQDKNGWCVEGSDDVRKRAMNAWNTRAASTIEAELECARGDLKTAMEIAEKNRIDAERYRKIRDKNFNPGCLCSNENYAKYFLEYMKCEVFMDFVVDLAIEKERT